MNNKFLPETQVTFNLVIYLSCMLIACIGIFYGKAILENYTFLRVWDFRNILILFLGIPFLWLQSRATFPNFWEKSISIKYRLLIPGLIGVFFGITDVLVIKFLLHPEPYTELPPFLQPFPYSLFLYFSGAFEIEVFYRLIPMTIFLLLGAWYQKGKYLNTIFWIAAILTSIREPLEQLPEGGFLFISYSLITGFLMNFLQAIYLKKSGFLASLFIRFGHYLFWHILLGLYVEYIELR